MKIYPCSDLHLEFVECSERINVLKQIMPSSDEIDVLVLAGDIFTYNVTNKVNIIDYLCNTYNDVIFVPGNHEYYEGSFEEIDLLLRVFERAFDNFYYLNNNHVFIDDLMFCGATLWFDYNKSNEDYEQYLNDFNLIYNNKNKFYEMNDAAIGYFNNLSSCNLDECVVVTHHAPHINSLKNNDNRFGKFKSYLDRFYYSSRAMELIDEWQPKYWIHGHTHKPVDYFVGKTHIISNPSGYVWNKTLMNRNMIIEIK